ncbi:unnamed protein product [Mytilus edulis]|uniref:Uncharacterized protein n=1 Tax=Mytilus edulis TaxID=6550 RepID=A0A8S3RD26_MYTED|nr:unnamed protein product [Mytilus edulis]
MAYLKLTRLVITFFIRITHGPIHVSCQIFPPPSRIGPSIFGTPGGGFRTFPAPALFSDVDERPTVYVIEGEGILESGFGGEFGGLDRGLDGDFDGGLNGGFGSLLSLPLFPLLPLTAGLVTTAAAVATTVADVTTAAATTAHLPLLNLQLLLVVVK